ncbi:O-antigen ligase family protein [Salinibacter ruber]|uniref:O-antigen ligase family protein n=1 Tax=Salinibacter ruber TaxID=146919 RepID=UPI002168084F|nr:O-antigen ligase family protein [Salinibacter ruber]MCS3648568.1 O-antigen ligase [Salinibacter ruber]
MSFITFIWNIIILLLIHTSSAITLENEKGAITKLIHVLCYISLVLSFFNILLSFGLFDFIGRVSYWYSGFRPIPNIRKASVLINTRGAYSSLVMIAFPFFLLDARYKILGDRWLWHSRRISFLAALLVLVGTFLTGSRSTWIAMLIAVLVTVGMIVVNSRISRAVTIAGIATGLVLYFLSDLLAFYELLTALREGSYEIRFVLQRMAWERFAENNYLGVDYGALSSLAGGHWLHNAYLVLLFGGGTLGSLPIFAYMLIAVGRGIRAYFAGPSKQHRVIAGGLLAGCSVTFVEWLAYGQMFNYASWLLLSLLFLLPLREDLLVD